MSRRFIVWVCGVMGMLVWGASGVEAAWLTDLDQGLAQARSLDRPLLVHIYGDQCLPCLVMEKKVLHQPEVVSHLRNGIVGVKINGNQRLDLCKQYGIQTYPSDVLLTPSGQVLGVSTGKRTLGLYLALLTRTEQQYAATRPVKRTTTTPPLWLADLEKARQRATSLQRPLLIHIYGESCIYCVVMEKKVFPRPEVTRLLKDVVVGVKIDGDRHPGLIKRYGIVSYPSDILLSPAGEVLNVSQGKRSVADYVALLSGAQQQFLASRSNKPNIIPGAATKVEPIAPDDAAKTLVDAGSKSTAPYRTTTETRLGLNGYSPVALTRDRVWYRGKPEFAWTHQGITFHLRNAEELKIFRQRAHQYAPRMLGCDPVLLDEERRATPGNMKYGAFYDGEFYMFATNDNRQKFKDEPYRYVRTRQVLLQRIEDDRVIR